ncbi:MAG: helicase-associated domain-containing protein [Anaerolineales bacterium]
MESLRVSLEAYSAGVVKDIAINLGLFETTTGLTKAEAVDALVEAIPRRAASPDFIAALSAAERAILAIILDAGGRVSRMDLVTPLVMAGLVRVEKRKGIGPDSLLPFFDDVMRAILLTGLVVNLTEPPGMRSRRDFFPIDTVGIPPEVLQVLPRELLSLPETNPHQLEARPPARVVEQDGEVFIRQLFFVWAELRREPGRALKAGGLYKRDRRRVAEAMGSDLEEVEEDLEMMIELLMDLELLVEQEGEIFAFVDEKAFDFWQQPLDAQVKQVLRSLGQVAFFEGINLGSIVQDVYVYGVPSAHPLSLLFVQLLDLLGSLSEAFWLPVADMLTLLNGGRPGAFIYSGETLDDLYRRLDWYSWGENKEVRKTKLTRNLRQAEQTALLHLLDPLVRTGVLYLGYDEGDQLPSTVRLSPLGRAALLGESWEAKESGQGQVVLQPDFQLLALGPVSLASLVEIERLTEREQVETATIGYRVTRQSIYGALQTGRSIPEILAFLERVTEQPVPQNVARTIREWGAQHERITVRQDVLVLHVESAALLQRLLDDAPLRGLLQPLGEQTAYVDAEAAPKVERRLWEMELLPALSQGPKADLPHSLRWQDGRLVSRVPLPSLYVTGTVRRFAEERDGGWELTAESIREAGHSGMTAPEVVGLVEEMTGRPLDDAWVKRVKAWMAHYGKAQTAEVRLLRLESAQVLEELRGSDRLLSRWLRPLTKGGPLAVVNEKHWDEVLELLAEWGVRVEEGRWW